ncbi:MAG: asparagine synthase (glutamine-hydrolyzing) [Planctomycetota bacterium]|nr:asparagine synthase (glutamine-hydrolyzing) [Planctomycetota bacterium]
MYTFPMCGIGGILRFDDQPIAPARLEAMLAAMRHRGPDGSGIAPLPHCGLVHARLSILDPSRGQQPMAAPPRGEQGGLTVVFNGEIYNHRELRRQLETLGHVFKTDHCDTEVLLHGCREWGPGLPERLGGMFAFAIWDARKRTLFLARDRVGKKPLFVLRRGPELLFGSEIATLLAPLPPQDRPGVNPAALRMFLGLGYAGLPSLLEGVEEIPAASWMTFDAEGRANGQTYWSPPAIAADAAALDALTREDPVAAAREAIAAAVAARLEADAPLGCFLSGGIDSSLVAALAQEELHRRGQGVLRTFSVAMPHAAYDESPFARQVALHIGSRHTELAADADQDVVKDLTHLVALSGEPTADSSLLPTYWLSRATRHHVAVALSGDGGDELFAGYDRYRATRLLAKHAGWLRRLPGSLLASNNPYSRRARVRRLAAAAGRNSPAGRYRSLVSIFSPEQVASLCPSMAADAAREAETLPDWVDAPDPAAAAMAWDFGHYLPFDLLRKVDRASMAVGLEVRCPLLDRSVCELAMRLPAAVRLPNGKTKAILRAAAAPLLPRGIVDSLALWRRWLKG